MLHDKSGDTMITVTHDVRCAEALCDRAILIADGTVKEQGGKEDGRVQACGLGDARNIRRG